MILLYAANTSDCVQYADTSEGYIRAVDDMRRFGGFIRDTKNDITNVDEALDHIHRICRAVYTLEAPFGSDTFADTHATIFGHLSDTYAALDREDWPCVNVRLLAAFDALNRLYAIHGA
jgi:hypothetical protein